MTRRRSSPTWTRDAVVAALRADYERTGRSPAAQDWRVGRYDRPTTETVRRRFGSWNAALRHAGIPRNSFGPGQEWPRDRIIDAMLDWVARHRRWPTSYQWRAACDRGTRPTTQLVQTRFGSWNAAKVAAGWTGAR